MARSLDEIFSSTVSSGAASTEQTTSPQGRSLDQLFDATLGQPTFTQQFESPKIDLAKFGGANLNAFQNLMAGFSPNDEVFGRFLQDEFENANVSQDTEGNLLLNGRRVNPAGFQFSDILRNLGFALPLAGQITGGVLGAPASPAGAIGAGIAGGLTGETARLSIGKLFGLDPSLAEASGSLAKEGLLAATGEIGGRGIAKVATVTGFDRALAAFWRNTFGKLGKVGQPVKEKVAEFVGGVGPTFVRKSSRQFNFQNLTEEFFDEGKGVKIASKTLFGNENVPSITQTIRRSGIQKGSKDIAKSINDIQDDSFDLFISRFGGISDESISVMRQIEPRVLFNTANTSESKVINVADSIINAAKKESKLRGSRITAKENAILGTSAQRKLPFATDDLARRLDTRLSQAGLTGGIKVPGFVKLPPIEVKGAKELIQIRNRLGTTVSSGPDKGKFLFFGAKAPSGQFTNTLTKGQAIDIRRQVETLADSIIENPSVSGRLKGITLDFMQDFRDRYATAIGVADENKAFSLFKSFADRSQISRNDPQRSLVNQIRNFRNSSPLEKRRLTEVLDQISESSAGKVLAQKAKRDIGIVSTLDELKKLDVEKPLSRLTSKLDSKKIIDDVSPGPDEILLKQFDESFRLSKKPRLKRRAFIKEAEASVSAKGFKEGAPNLLRVGAVANLLGAGAIGTAVGGPVGGLAGASIALSLSNPLLIAQVLRRISGQRLLPSQLGQLAGRGSKGLQQAGPAVLTRLLGASSGSS